MQPSEQNLGKWKWVSSDIKTRSWLLYHFLKSPNLQVGCYFTCISCKSPTTSFSLQFYLKSPIY